MYVYQVSSAFKIVEDFIKLEGHELDVLIKPQAANEISKGRLSEDGFIIFIFGESCYDMYDVTRALENSGYRTRNLSCELHDLIFI